MTNSYLAITRSSATEAWLTAALAGLGNTITVSDSRLEQVLQLAESAPASALFIEMNPADYRQEIQLMQELTAAQSMLPVFVIGNEANQDMLLSAMRAGARDFIRIGASAEEVARSVQRWANFTPRTQLTAASQAGRVTAVISARPNADAAMLAIHLALVIGSETPTLLLDIGVPQGDATFFLGLAPKFTFIDALNNLHHLDATLIETGFEKHKSGLTILSLPDEPWSDHQVSSTDINMLMHVLRRHFSQIVVNLGGTAQSGLLTTVLVNSDQNFLLIEQTLPSCQQNLHLLKHLREKRVPRGRTGLVIDRYLPKLKPDAASLAKSFDLPLLGILPPCGMDRIATMNSGISMLELAPNSAYVQQVRKLAKIATDDTLTSEPSGLWQRLKHALFPQGGHTWKAPR